jgi:tRNA (cytidine/uridine-2'-O-)-methyltransferase
MYAFTTKASRPFAEADFQPGDVFLFGPETRGLPTEVLAGFPDGHRLRLPMRPGQRSLNLSNACAVVVFEAWRRAGYAGAAG